MGADDWHDPHGLIPATFKREYRSFESVRDALDHQARLPSSTPEAARARCPDCGSTSITPHNTGPHGPAAPGDWKCTECKTWLDDPEEPTMTDYDTKKSTRFRWNREEDILLPKNRSPLEAPLADFDDETLRGLAIAVYQPWTDSGPSYRDMAPIFPYSRKWIGDQVRAWKAGEYRELVADPTAADVEPITVDESSASTALATDGGRRRRRWDAYGT